MEVCWSSEEAYGKAVYLLSRPTNTFFFFLVFYFKSWEKHIYLLLYMLKILFLHGLASSGSYKMADMLRQLLRPCEVTAPDLPIDLDQALGTIHAVLAMEKPDLVVGLSWGGFLALRSGAGRIVAVNPDLDVSVLLGEHIGPMDYLSPRKGGEISFLITEDICERYRQAEKEPLPVTGAVLGCFAEQDTLVNCSDKFESLFPGKAFRYPGGHLPTYPEMKNFIVPAIRSFLEGGR